MTVSVYRKGNTHKVRGVECEVVRCSFKQMADFLAAGCVKVPEELLNKTEQKAVAKVLETEQVNLNMDRELIQHG